MADNLTTTTTVSTVPSGTIIATDEIAGSVHVQRIKLMDGTLNGTDGIPGDATNGLDVDVTRVSGTVTVGDGGSTISIDDGAGSITVDGTVAISGTVAVTDNSGTLSVDDGGGSLTVDGTVTVQDGGSTISVDDGGGSITVDGTVAATQSGAWSVRLTDGTDTADVLDLTNSNPLTVAIVDGSGDQITSFGGGVQYTEGDTDATITGTVAMWEDTSNTVVATSAAKPLPVEIIAGAGSGGTAAQDESTFTEGTTNFTPVGGVYNDALASDPASGEAAAVRITSDRAMHVNLRGATGTELGTNAAPVQVGDAGGTLSIDDGGGNISIDDGGNSITVDGTVGVSGTVTVDTELAAAITFDANNGNAVPNSPVVHALFQAYDAGNSVMKAVRTANNLSDGAQGGTLIPVHIVGYNGSTFDRLRSDTTNGLDVDVTRVSGTVTTGGVAAHDAAISGNPVRIGGRAVNAEVTAVANGDTADLITDLTGKQIILPYANPENFLAGKTSDITGTSDTSVIAAQGVGVRIYVTQVVVQNSHASVGTWVDIEDGTSAIYTIYAPSGGGGASVTFPVPLRLTANTALQAKCATTGANVRVSASGYKGV